MRVPFPLLASLACLPLVAQDPGPRFRVGLGLGAGNFDYETDGSNLAGDTDAGFFRLHFEGTSRSGIGGGIRLESIASDDDLFVDAGFPASEATMGTVFGHFTYRLQHDRFVMPMRAGLLFNGLTLEEQATSNEVTFGSIGPYFEVAPELILTRSDRVQWSLFAEVGIGAGITAIDIDGDPTDYDSTTGFYGFEFGTRVLVGPVELGLSYVGRWQSMDDSDVENGVFVLGNDVDFQGVVFGVSVVF